MPEIVMMALAPKIRQKRAHEVFSEFFATAISRDADLKSIIFSNPAFTHLNWQ